MKNNIKKIMGVIATIAIFLIGGYFYLSAPDEDNVAGGGSDYQQEYIEDSQKTEDIAQTTELASTESITETATEAATEASTEAEVLYEFRKQQYLDEHFDKHGEEFDYENAQEYLEGANRVINDPNSLYKTEAEDGDYIYYLESTNEFVVLSTDGYIRTYFKPSAGIDYFNRQ